MTNDNLSQIVASIWSVTDLLRGDFKQTQYGRVLLPFTLLRRLECILEPAKKNIIDELERVKFTNKSEVEKEALLLQATQTPEFTDGLSFFNTSAINFGNIDKVNIKSDLEKYVQSFSKDVLEIFENFRFDEVIGHLADADLLYKVVRFFAVIDFSLEKISNYEMGLVFDKLIQRFAESSNETAGEHFTPRDIVRLTTSLVLMEESEIQAKDNIVRTIYDPTAGMGSFLSAGIEYMHELNSKVIIQAYGQELNPESYAICKADMLINGQDIKNIKNGNTLSNDQLPINKFDYLISHPPFGLDWKRMEEELRREYEEKGLDGRFGAGLPRINDGSLLFLMHLISKMHNTKNHNGQILTKSRIGIILNGSPLFSGGAGSGESEIRRYIIEEDLLEAIVALPTDIFYNTGIATYIWILTNKKTPLRKGKVQLINARDSKSKLRRTIGSKRHYLNEDEIKAIINSFSNFSGNEVSQENGDVITSKICDAHDFGYRRLIIERPLRLSIQTTDEAIESLRFAAKPYNLAMQAIYEKFGGEWEDDSYGSLTEVESLIRSLIKKEFSELKEKQIKNLLTRELWIAQKNLMDKAKALQFALGNNLGGKFQQSDDFNEFNFLLEKLLESTGIQFDVKQKRQFIDAITWKNPEAEPVIKNKLTQKPQPLYGAFNHKGQVVEFYSDNDLRDSEDVTLEPGLSTSKLIEDFFLREVYPYAKDSWISTEKRDAKDGGLGLVGYRFNLNSYFQKNHFRDKLLQGKSVRLKEIVKINASGIYVLESSTGRVIEFSTLGGKLKIINPIRFDFSQETLIPEFYNIFLQQEEGRDWIENNFTSLSGGVKNVSVSAWLNTRLSLPSIGVQSKLIDFWAECESLLTRISLLKDSVFSDFQSAQEQLLPYQSVASRYEQEFSSMLPTPLAILWELAESKFNERERCEAFTKFYEYLGLYLVSFIFGEKKPTKDIFYKGRKDILSITMAFGYKRIEEFKGKLEPNSGLAISVCRNEIVNILNDITELRNDIAHRGLPSALSVTKAKETIQRLNKTMQLEFRDFFETTTLIKPIQAKFDGNGFLNEVEVLKGLGLNPGKTAQFKTSTPMISGELYLAHSDLTLNESVAVTKMFPLMLMSETLPESEIMGFYFYSDVLDDKLRFVCPYPNVETYKFFDRKIITDCLEMSQ